MSSGTGQLNESVRMEKQQVGNDSRLSLDQRFSGGGRRSSTRLRHQSLDRGVARQSLDQRFTWTGMEDSQAASKSLGQRTTGAGQQLPTTARSVCPSISVALSVHCRSDESGSSMDNADESMEQQSLGQRTIGADGGQLPTTASRCRWAQASSVDRQQMDQQFDDNDYRLSATGFHHLEAAVEQQDNGVGLQLPMTATTSHGQQTSGSSVAMDHGYNGQRTTSSHSTRTSTNVDGWTSDGLQHSSISGSAGAQLRNTDKASRTDMESRTAKHDNQASTHGKIGSTESRLATLRRTLDCNEEVDDFVPSNVDSIGQRSAPPSATAGVESSAGHRIYASPEGPKVVDVNLQVGLGSRNVEEELVTCRTDGRNRFNSK